MKNLKLKGFYKFLSLLLIAILVVSAVGFAASGRETTPTQPGSSNAVDTNGEADKNTDKNASGDTTQDNISTPDENKTPPIETEPEVLFYSKISGLEITEEEYTAVPKGLIVDPTRPLYGVSKSELTIEFPIEDGTSRLVAYTTNSEVMWKIGSLRATRNFISNMSNFFGGVVVSYGKDDKVAYDAWETENIVLDLSQYSDCYYIENTLYVYTSENMVDIAANRMSASSTPASYKNAPYTFSDSEVSGITAATTISIPYSDQNITNLYYHEGSGKYLYYKGDNRRVDMLTGENISFCNVFILFSNATTYENSDGTELVIDTVSGGRGYYISMGGLTEFTWSVTKGGDLTFKNLMGETLTVNRGTAYIAYYKASLSANISFN